MAVRRPTGPLPLGNARRGFQHRAVLGPGAGERPPQSEVYGGFTPRGDLPTRYGSTGLKPFYGGRTSAKRSYQQLTARRVSPFFIATPAAVESPSPGGFSPQIAGAERMNGRGRKRKLSKLEFLKKRAGSTGTRQRASVGEILSPARLKEIQAKKAGGGMIALGLNGY